MTVNGFHIHVAGRFHKWFFRLLARYVTRTPEVYGCYFPWGIYVVEEYKDAQWLVRHEIAHAKQRARDGFVAYWLKTFWFIWKYGYVYSPYEIEARAAQSAD
jgi:hypothetical protein